jgi:hypothetical protein
MSIFRESAVIRFFMLEALQDSNDISSSCLKEPKCEIFFLLDSRQFYTTKPQWVGNFETEIKNKYKDRFGLDCKVFFSENFVLAHAEYVRKKVIACF